MKKRLFLLGIVVLLLSVVSLSNLKSNQDQEVALPKTTTLETEVIEYDELTSYIELFKTGDIINIENSNYLSSYAIPGRWKHSIFYLGTYQQFNEVFTVDDKYYQEINNHYQTKDEILVLDSNSTGVKIRTLDQMANLKKESYLKALSGYRFNEDKNFIKNYLNRALDYLDTPYDYSMTTYDDSALYCSELVYYALLANDIEINKTSTIVDHIVITPTDLSDFLETLDDIEHVYLLEKNNEQIVIT